MFARRAAWDLTPNEPCRKLAARRAAGLPVLDLSDANPTRCGLAPTAALKQALTALANDPTSARYEPDPRGDPAARAAIAAYHARRGAGVSAEQVVLCAGTSEGYAHLFRLLADPGDVVHVPSPGYPLFEHLAALEGVAVTPYPLVPTAGARWRIDLDALAASLSPRSRVVLVIDPHNPTGSFVDPEDWASLRSIAQERGLALISDEVFADFAHADLAPPPGALAGSDAGLLHFVLSGASKVLALPQLKLAWIVAAGRAAARNEALARLEFIADAYLSVSPILSCALPELLAQRDAIQRPILDRVARNRAGLEAALARSSGRVLASEAGWSAVVAVPDRNEAALVAQLLDDDGVVVQPGSLFDLDRADAPGVAHLVVSLLPEPDRFDRGLDAIASVIVG